MQAQAITSGEKLQYWPQQPPQPSVNAPASAGAAYAPDRAAFGSRITYLHPVTFHPQTPAPVYVSPQIIGLLRLANDSVNRGDVELAKSSYTRATYLARSTDEFLTIAQHASARSFHTAAREALMTGAGYTTDVHQLLRLASASALNRYASATNDIYEIATSHSRDFYQLMAIARHAQTNGYDAAARKANQKAISMTSR